MAILFDKSSVASTNPDATTLTWNHTNSGFGNTYLIVAICLRNNRAVSTVTYNSVSMTFIREDNPGTDVRTELWYLPNPAVGINSVLITAGSSTTISAIAATFYNVSGLGNNNGAGSNVAVTSGTVNVTSATGELVISALGLQSLNGSAAVSGGQTLIAKRSGTANAVALGYLPGTGTATMSWTFTSDRYALSAVALKPVGITAQTLVVGGGGAGGSRVGGGGGGGGLVYDATHNLTAQTYAVTVGSGGNAVTDSSGVGVAGNNGQNSVFDNLTATGGGGGGAYTTPASGSNGGCGGGAAGYTAGIGGTGSQGYNGGGPSNGGAGGGGGMNSVGGSGVLTTGGNGGSALSNSISGSSTPYCAGGGGSADVVGGTGGSGIGGNGTAGTANPAGSGTANTGSGGGGARDVADSGGFTSGAGGSGIVILSYVTANFSSFNVSVTGTGNTVAVSGSNTIITFITSGNLIVTGGSSNHFLSSLGAGT